MNEYGGNRWRIIIPRLLVLIIFGVLILRVGYLQLIDSRYESLAGDNYLRYVVKYPPRGEVFDRNGEYLVQSKICYDLMAVWRDMPRSGVDTLRLLDITGLTLPRLKNALYEARRSPRQGRLVAKYLSAEEKLQLDELNIPGLYTVPRTVRQYPRKIGGNLLGSVGEITDKMLKNSSEYYGVGDYIGTEGLEAAYEEELRGVKGLVLHDLYARDEAHDQIINHRVF